MCNLIFETPEGKTISVVFDIDDTDWVVCLSPECGAQIGDPDCAICPSCGAPTRPAMDFNNNTEIGMSICTC